jgi:cell wall-associated NlpC family hydrolase
VTDPLPGDFACVSIGGQGGKLIRLGEELNGDAFAQYQHAFIYVGGMRVEAEPGGARAVQMTVPVTPGQATAWSTGKIPLTQQQRDAICAAARGYIGTGYSWLDYAAIAARRLRLPVPGLKAYIASTGHMICSALVDRTYQDAGVQLFDDHRWNGYVTPADLAGLIS